MIYFDKRFKIFYFYYRGFAFVEFVSIDEAKNAYEAL